MRIQRSLATGATVLIAALTLAACGDDGGNGEAAAPTDAAKSDFCSAFMDSSAIAGAENDADRLEAAKEGIDNLEQVGTPQDVSDEQREGFEIYVEEIQSADDVSDLEKVSDEDAAKVGAFTEYTATTCADQLADELSEGSTPPTPSDQSS